MHQNYRFGFLNTPRCIEIHERIARFLILTNYELSDDAHWVKHQRGLHEEQLNGCLKSLDGLYQDARVKAREQPWLVSPNEAEFSAYCMYHPSPLLPVQRLTLSTGRAPRMQTC